MNNAVLKQLINARKFAIHTNPKNIIVDENSKITNDYGIEYNSSNITSHLLSGVRIAHYNAGFPEREGELTSDTIKEVYYLISDNNTPLKKGWKFTDNSKSFETEDVEAINRFGVNIGYRARLKDNTELK